MNDLARYDTGDIWKVYEGYEDIDTVEPLGGEWCKASDVEALESLQVVCTEEGYLVGCFTLEALLPVKQGYLDKGYTLSPLEPIGPEGVYPNGVLKREARS